MWKNIFGMHEDFLGENKSKKIQNEKNYLNFTKITKILPNFSLSETLLWKQSASLRLKENIHYSNIS